MGTIATLAVKIIGNVEGLEQALSKAQQSLRSAGDNLTNLGGKLTAGVSLPLLGVGGAALKAAADNEQLQVAFTTMLGSAEQAKGLMSDLAQFAAATPFESDEIQGAAKMLLAYGSSAGGVTEELRSLGDIAAGVGVPLKDMAYLYGTARVQGRLFTADINQFTSRGVPIMEALAATMGVATSEIRGMVEAGKIGFPELQAALGYLTGEGGKFNGLMQAQSTTLTGLFSTLKDNVSLAMIDIGNAISQAFDLKGSAAKAIAFIEGIRNTISDLAKNNPGLLRMGVIIAAVAAAAGPLLVGLGMALKAAAALTPVVSILGGALGALLSPLGLAAAAVAALAAAFALDWGGIRTGVMGAADGLLALAGVDLGGMAAGLRAFGSYLLEAGSNGRVINQWLGRLPEAVRPAVATLGQVAAALRGLVTTGDIGKFVVTLQKINWAGALASVQRSVVELRSRIAAILQGVDWGGVLRTAGGWASSLSGGIASILGAIDWTGALRTTNGWLRTLTDGVTNALAAVDWSGALTAAGDGLHALVVGVVGSIRSVDWGAALTAVDDALVRLRGGVMEMVATIDWNGMAAGIGNAFTNLGASIAGGLRSALGKIVSTFSGLAAGVVGAIQGVDWTELADGLFAGLGAAVSGGLATLGLGGVAAQVQEQMAAVAAAVQPVADFVAPAVGRLGAALGALPGRLAPLAGKFMALLDALQPLIAALGAGLAVAADWGVNTLAAALDVLPGVVGATVDQMTATLRLFTTAFGGVVQFVRSALRGDWTAAWTGARAIVTSFVTYLSGTLERQATVIGGLIQGIARPILDTLSDLGVDVEGSLNGIRDTFANAWQGIAGALGPALTAIGELRGALGGLMQGGDLGAFVQSIQAIDWGAALGAMGAALGELASGVGAALRGVNWSGALSAAGDWLADLRDGVVAAIQGIGWAAALTTAAGWLDGLTSGVVAAIKDFGWAGALSTAGDAFAGLETAVADGLRGMGFNGAASALDGLTGALGNLPSATTAAQAAIGTINAALYSAKTAFDSAGSAVGTFLAADAWTTAQTDITTALGAIGTALAGVFAGDVSLSELKDTLVTQFGDIQTTLGALFVSEEWTALGGSLLAAFGLEGLAADITAKVETVKTAFQPLVDFLEPAFTRLQGTVGGLPAQFDDLAAKFEPLKAAAGELAAALGGLFGGGGEAGSSGGGGVTGNVMLGAALAGTLSLLTNTVNGLVGALAPLAGAFVDELTTLLSGLATVVTGLGIAFQGIVTNDPTLVLQGLGTAFQGVKDIVTGTFENSLTAVQTALTAIGGIVSTTLGDWGFGAAATAVDGMVASINTLLEKIKAIASGDASINFAAPDWIVKLLEWLWPSLDLPDLLASLLSWQWPTMTLPDLLGTLLGWKWPDFTALPDWVTSLLNWTWPSLDMPDWLNNLFNFEWPGFPQLPSWLGGPQETAKNQAVGTSYFGGGLVNASEVTPEIAVLPRGVSRLPRGMQILSGNESAALLAGAGGGVTVIIQQATFRNERDMQRFAYEVDDLMQRRKR